MLRDQGEIVAVQAGALADTEFGNFVIQIWTADGRDLRLAPGTPERCRRGR